MSAPAPRLVITTLAGGGRVPLPASPGVVDGRWAGQAGPRGRIIVVGHAGVMRSVTNINEVLEGHVALEVECVDRLYLNGCVPVLQVGVLRSLDGSDPHAAHRCGPRRGLPAVPAASSKRSWPTMSTSAGPEQVAVVFARQVCKTTREPFRTCLFSAGSDVKIDFAYKHSRVKQYLKDGRALRIEAVINKPSDLGVLARIEHLPLLIAKARAVNQRLLMIERAGQSCAIGSALFERIHQPYHREGQRTGALRFGDQRAMALAGALTLMLHAVTGFTNKSLRGHVAGYLGQDYSAGKMSYDLRRLRPHGPIRRLPHSNAYILTPEGIRVAAFYTKLQNRLLRLLRPPIEADQPPPRQSRSAAPSPPSSAASTNTSKEHASHQLPKLVTNPRVPATKKD